MSAGARARGQTMLLRVGVRSVRVHSVCARGAAACVARISDTPSRSVACLAMSTLSGAQADGPSRQAKIEGAFFGALVADALTLGTHYEYDAKKIKQFYGQIDRYYAPGEKTGGQTHGVGWGQRNYHDGNGRGPPKRAGEQTDYGDCNTFSKVPCIVTLCSKCGRALIFENFCQTTS